jgi:hypothetical protein
MDAWWRTFRTDRSATYISRVGSVGGDVICIRIREIARIATSWARLAGAASGCDRFDNDFQHIVKRVERGMGNAFPFAHVS